MARLVKTFGALVVVLAAASAWAQTAGTRGFAAFYGGAGRPQSGVMLLAIDEVRTELGTTAEQNAKINRLFADLRPKGEEAFGGYEALRPLPDDERQRRIDEARANVAELNTQADAQLATILTPQQNDRLNQLKLQAEGGAAIAQPEVAEQLGLTEEQKGKVARIVEAASARPVFRGNRDLSEQQREQRRTQARERREKAQPDFLAVLTSEQMRKWNELQGDRFTFPAGAPGR